MPLWYKTTRVLENKSVQYKLLCEKRKDEYCNKHVNKNFGYEIKSYNTDESDWSQAVNTNRVGGEVNIIMIKCVLFLQKGSNAEKIVV